MFILYSCPSCGGEEYTVLRKNNDEALVKCEECGHVYRFRLPGEPEMIPVKTIVSFEKESRTGITELEPDEICSVGEQRVAEIGEDIHGVEITGIETETRRVKRSKAEDITALWTRAIDTVAVRVSVHDRRKTVPIYVACDGEAEFSVGEQYTVKGMNFRITHIKLRNGSLMRKEGWRAFAKKIKRIYGIRI